MDLHASTVHQSTEREVDPEIEAGEVEAEAEVVDREVDHVTEDREADHVTDHEKMATVMMRRMCSLSCSEWQYMNRRGGFNRPLDYVQ